MSPGDSFFAPLFHLHQNHGHIAFLVWDFTESNLLDLTQDSVLVPEPMPAPKFVSCLRIAAAAEWGFSGVSGTADYVLLEALASHCG